MEPERTAAEPGDEAPTPEGRVRSTNNLRIAMVLLILGWTYFYNVLIKGHGPVEGFFEILDTISDDFVMGTGVTILVGLLIVALFSVTKLYTQIISNIYSFAMIETLITEDLARGEVRRFVTRLFHFDDIPHPSKACPSRVSTLLLSFCVLYVMSWVYVLVFSEALFFVAWSAGVDLPISERNLLYLPLIALAIPFSARVMAYMRYPYAQDYADFMPGAVFVLVMVAALGRIYETDAQKFFLVEVFKDPGHTMSLLRNGCSLAFIPVFFEAGFWLVELGREEKEERGGEDDGEL